MIGRGWVLVLFSILLFFFGAILVLKVEEEMVGGLVLLVI